MLNPKKPILRVNKAWFADSTRVVKDRLPGAFKQIVNIIPNLTDGIGRVRTGFEEYTTALGGHDAPANTKILKCLPIQNPQEDDIHLYFCETGGAYSVYMWPHYIGASQIDEDILLSDFLSTTGTFTVSANILTFTSLPAGMSTTNDTYNGWIAFNYDRGTYAMITDYTYVGASDIEFTFVEDIDSFTSPWTTGDEIIFYRNFHDNPYDSVRKTSGFNPKFNDDKANPPTANVENSIIRFSGGQGTHLWLRGVWLNPRLTRTFFTDHARSFTFDKSYASERELKTPTIGGVIESGNEITTTNGGGTTETLVPISDAGGEHWRPIPAGFLLWDKIDDGATPNDSEYIYPLYYNRKTWNWFNLTTLSAPLVEGGTITVYVRYRNYANPGQNVLYVQLINSDGTVLGGATFNTDTGAAWQNDSFTILQTSAMDPSGWHLYIQTDGNTNNNDVRISNIYLTVETLTDTEPLLPNKTYWPAIAPIYDGYQLGALLRFEDSSYYFNTSGQWTVNRLEAYQGIIALNFAVSAATVDKRITGYAIYMAVDDGQVTERTAKYQFMKSVSITDTDPYSSGWTYDAGSGTFQQTITINQADIDRQGNTYETDAGISETLTGLETMLAYSVEEIVGGRRVMANVYGYVGPDAALEPDKTFLFTNPQGGNPSINLGIPQIDSFPAEEGVYQLRIQPILGTKINGIAPVGVDEMIVMKDRGVVSGRIIIINGYPDIAQTIISPSAGLTTVNEWTKDEEGNIYFPGYDDIYAIKGNVLAPIIERDDKNDWIDTYRGMSIAQRELATVFYLPETKSAWFLFNNVNGATFTNKQFMYYKGLWSQLSIQETVYDGVPTIGFRWSTKLRNGHTIVTGTEATPKTYRMSFEYSGGTYPFVYDDDGTAIVPYIDTGDLYIGGESVDAFIRKVVVNTTLNSANDLEGSLTVSLVNDTLGGHIGTSLSLTDRRLSVYIPPRTVRAGASWKIIYNAAASGRARLKNGVNTFHFNSIEYFGDLYDRVRSDGK